MSLVTVAEAATRLNISQDAVRKRVQRGTIKGVKDNRGRLLIELPEDTNQTMSGQRPVNVQDKAQDTKTAESQQLQDIIQDQHKTIDRLVLMVSDLQDEVLDLKRQKKIADDRSRKAMQIIKDNANKL